MTRSDVTTQARKTTKKASVAPRATKVKTEVTINLNDLQVIYEAAEELTNNTSSYGTLKCAVLEVELADGNIAKVQVDGGYGVSGYVTFEEKSDS